MVTYHEHYASKYSCKPSSWLLLVKKVSIISQGSVASRLRCGSIFDDDIVTYLLQSLTTSSGILPYINYAIK